MVRERRAPSRPSGWYADASGAWWWWDGRGWTPQVAPGAWGAAGPEAAERAARSQERSTAMVMWIVYLVGGGFIGALVFYFVARDKAFVRHHAAEALNLTLALLVPQVAAVVLAGPWYLDYLSTTIDDPNATVDPTSSFWIGLALIGVATLLNYIAAITGAVMAHRGRWWRLPIGLHPVRGVARRGQEPYSVT